MFCLLFYNPPIRDILLLLFKAGKGIESAAENGFNPYATRILRFVAIIPSGHSCASMLLANGVPMKQIQDWMGHSDFSTTANIYAHLDYQSKVTSAEAMLAGLGLKAAGIEPLSE